MKENLAIIIGKLTGGGAERIVGLLSEALASTYNVYLFLLEGDSVTYEFAGEVVIMEDVFPNQTLNSALYHCKGKYNIDIAISFLDGMNIANIKTRRNEKVIISSRCSYKPWLRKDSLLEQYIKKYYKKADMVVACSKGLMEQLIDCYDVPKDKVTYIYNFINTERILKKADEEVSDVFWKMIGDSEYFISVGRLDEQKNQKALIKQFKMFYEENKSDYKLAIIGSGPLEDEIREMIRIERLSDRVIIMPYCKNPFPYIRGALAFIMPSNYEGLPNALMEAMTLGVPVAATDCMTGPRELLLGHADYKNGVITKNAVTKRGILIGKPEKDVFFDRAYIGNALTWFVENKDELARMGLAEKEFMDEYSHVDYTSEWINVISDISNVHIENNESFFEDDIDRLAIAKKVYIYGAGKVGKRVYNTYKTVCNIVGFIVTNNVNEEKKYMGLPIFTVDEIDLSDSDTLIVVGVGFEYVDEICDILDNLNCCNYIVPI